MKVPSNLSSQKNIFLLWAFFYICFSPNVCGQVPQGIPKDMGPVDLSSPANIVIYIVLPLIVIIGIFFWRAGVKKRKKKEEEEF